MTSVNTLLDQRIPFDEIPQKPNSVEHATVAKLTLDDQFPSAVTPQPISFDASRFREEVSSFGRVATLGASQLFDFETHRCYRRRFLRQLLLRRKLYASVSCIALLRRWRDARYCGGIGTARRAALLPLAAAEIVEADRATFTKPGAMAVQAPLSLRIEQRTP